MEKQIAYCGVNCAECDAYLAMKNNDQALRKKAAVEFSEVFEQNYTPDMMNCIGCKDGSVLLPHCSDCEIRKCASEKDVVNCGACSEFKTCKLINDFIVAMPHVLDNLK